jgi:hypothetical protein
MERGIFQLRKGRYRVLIILSLMVFLMTFSVVSAASPPVSAGKTYKFLNPAGIPGPIEVQGLAPRLDTIKGKTIYVHVCEAGPQTGPYLHKYLEDKYPDTKWVHIQNNGFGPTRPEQEVLDNADALIGGQSW